MKNLFKLIIIALIIFSAVPTVCARLVVTTENVVSAENTLREHQTLRYQIAYYLNSASADSSTSQYDVRAHYSANNIHNSHPGAFSNIGNESIIISKVLPKTSLLKSKPELDRPHLIAQAGFLSSNAVLDHNFLKNISQVSTVFLDELHLRNFESAVINALLILSAAALPIFGVMPLIKKFHS